MSATDYLRNELCDHVFRGAAFAAPSELWVGLLKTEVEDQVELSGNGYARVEVTGLLVGTGGGGAAEDGRVSNLNNTISFPTPTGDGDPFTHVGLWDAETDGNLLALYPMPESQAWATGVPVLFREDQLEGIVEGT